MKRVLVALAAFAVTACGSSAMTSPSQVQLVAALPDNITARLVTCATCSQPPFSWQTAEFDLTVSDPLARGGVVASIEAVARNTTRGAELGRNRIPNATTVITRSSVPVSGSLTTSMALTFDVPPPRDDVQVTVTVTLTDGRTATATARVAPGAA